MKRLTLLVAVVVVLALGSALGFAYMELRQRNEPKLRVAPDLKEIEL